MSTYSYRLNSQTPAHSHFLQQQPSHYLNLRNATDSELNGAVTTAAGNNFFQQTRSPIDRFHCNNMSSPHLLSASSARKKRPLVLECPGNEEAVHLPVRNGQMTLENAGHGQSFYTNFCKLLRQEEPAVPPLLFRNPSRKENGPGKVKILLRVAGPLDETGSSWMTVDHRRKQVNILDPSMASSGSRTRSNAALPLAPKMFNFDSVFSPDSSQSEISSASLLELIHGVVGGADGCLISYGHAKLGKTYTVVGCDTSARHAGLIPSAISWLFRLISDEQDKTGARFTVRVSAVEVSGIRETVTDLLADQANGHGRKFSCDDPKFSSPLMSPNEMLAGSAEKAALWLDAALSTRRKSGNSASSHMFFSLHVHQFRVDKSGSGGVSGLRSRLHLIDLGSQAGEMSASGLGNVILALVNGEKHVPFKESKLTQLLKNALSNVAGNTALVCHVSSAPDKYSDTLSVVKMASRIHRVRRRKIRTGVGYSSADSSRLFSSTASSDPSSSEVSSATTVIFCGNGSPPMDGDHRRRIQTNPNLKLMRLPPGSPKLSPKGAPHSYLSLVHNSPVRSAKPTVDMVSDIIQPVILPRPIAKAIVEDKPVLLRTESLRRALSRTDNNVDNLDNQLLSIASVNLKNQAITQEVPKSLKVTKQTQARRTPTLGKTTWSEGNIDPSKRDMIQKWVELQSPEEESQHLLDRSLPPCQGTEATRSSIENEEGIETCDAFQQVSQLDILHETHELCAGTPEPHFLFTAADEYGISRRDLEELDALDTLASHLSSQLDLLSVELADSFTDEVQLPVNVDLPEPMKALVLPEVAPVWERIGTFPRKIIQKEPEQVTYSTNSLKRKAPPTPPARSSSVPRPKRDELFFRTCEKARLRSIKQTKLLSSPTKNGASSVARSPDLSQDSSHDSGFSVSSAKSKLTRMPVSFSAPVNSKRSPSQSSSGLGSDGNSSISSVPAQIALAKQTEVGAKRSPVSQGAVNVISQHEEVIVDFKSEVVGSDRSKISAKGKLWTKLPCFGGVRE